MKLNHLIAISALTLTLTACGTLTGIPAHGGGKRFAVEQELVAASARAAAREMDLRALQGRRVALYIVGMGDQGSGTLSGGRYSVEGLIRGEYLNTPASRTGYAYPRYETTANTVSGDLSGLTTSLSTLNAPSASRTESDGSGSRSSLGLNMNGTGDYRNETLTANPRDSAFLSHLLQTVFFLRGIEVVPPALADTDVFVNVDVFGTIRSRTELHIRNAESLKAQTKLEYLAVDRNSRQLLIRPQSLAFEAEYRENYILWSGPYKTVKSLKAAEGLMADFSGIEPYASAGSRSAPPVHEAAGQEGADGASPRPAYGSEILRKRQQGR